MEVLWLSSQDVNTIGLTPEECMSLVQQTVEWQSEGLLEVPPKLGIHPPKGRHIHAMPAYIAPLEMAGVKWVGDFPQNEKQGLPTINALVILSSPETGVPLCVLEGGRITAMRTAAMTGVTLRACAVSGAKVAAIVGTGTQASAHVRMLPQALPSLTTIRVVGREPAMAADFCRDLGPLVGRELIPCSDREEATKGADVVVTVTNSVKTRLLELEWLAPGVTVVVLDNGGKETSILHSMDRVIVDDLRPFTSEEVRERFSTGVPRIDGELGEILKGRRKGRTNAQERILVLNLGMAAFDVVVATEIYRRALKLRLGVRMGL